MAVTGWKASCVPSIALIAVALCKTRKPFNRMRKSSLSVWKQITSQSQFLSKGPLSQFLSKGPLRPERADGETKAYMSGVAVSHSRELAATTVPGLCCDGTQIWIGVRNCRKDTTNVSQGTGCHPRKKNSRGRHVITTIKMQRWKSKRTNVEKFSHEMLIRQPKT